MGAIVSGQKNIVFLHIPKTAGLSIRKWLGTYKGNSTMQIWEDHPPISFLQKQSSAFSFTVVRNPWERMVSFYFYIKNIFKITEVNKSLITQKNIKGIKYLMKTIKDINYLKSSVIKNNLDFKEWLKYIQHCNEDWNLFITKQTDYIDSEIDLIIKYENLYEEFKAIQKYYGVACELTHENKSNHLNYRDYYDDETKYIVDCMFAKDIDKLKYVF